jgi:hypothetical protein
MGVEFAQANAAYILERNFGGVQNHLSKEERKRFSLCFHELAADLFFVLLWISRHVPQTDGG